MAHVADLHVVLDPTRIARLVKEKHFFSAPCHKSEISWEDPTANAVYLVSSAGFDRLHRQPSFNGAAHVSKIIQLRSLLFASVVAGCLALSGNANATDCHAPQYIVKTVTVYVEIEQPYSAYVTKYDHCGTPYQVRVIRYKTVSVPIEKKVRVYL